jgi:hypothetical protein
MKSIRQLIGFVGAVLCLTVAHGCDSGESTVAPVHGTVYYRGFPLRSGTVVFAPDGSRGTDGPLARGDIKPDGTYELRTDQTSGAVVGWHRVTIVAMESALVHGSSGPYYIPRSLLPEKYSDPDLSGLVCEVRAHQANRIDFRLE